MRKRKSYAQIAAEERKRRPPMIGGVPYRSGQKLPPLRAAMRIGYARVSSGEQSVEAQVKALRESGCVKIYHEHASGVAANRPELKRALAQLQEGDELVVWKVDRLARSLFQFLQTLARIEEAGAVFRSLTEAIDTSTAIGKLAIGILGSFAEFERAMIRERTVEGLKLARSRGARPGRKRVMTGAKCDAALKLMQTETLGRVALMLGVSVSTLKRERARRRNEATNGNAQAETTGDEEGDTRGARAA